MNSVEREFGDTENRPVLKKNALKVRFWHWANVLIIFGSLLTVLINSTLLDKDNAGLVKDELFNAGVTIDAQQARSVLHGMEDQVWGIHIYSGYALALLLLFRSVSEFLQPADHRLVKKLKVAYRQYIVKPKDSRLARHELFTKGLYTLFYLLLLLMVITGLVIAFDKELSISNSLSHQIKEIHGFIMYMIIGFIVLHVLGVFLAEQKEGKGIVSDMINGGLIEK